MSGVIRRTLGRLGWCLLGVVVVASVGVTFGAATGQWRVIPMLSGSMSPYLRTGDAAFARPVPSSELVVGDIVVFQRPETDPSEPPTVHRIVRMDSVDGVTVLRTKGDANPIVDSWELTVSEPTVWRVDRSLPKVGTAVLSVKQPTVWFGALILVGLVMLVSSLRPVRPDDTQIVGEHEIGTDVAKPVSSPSTAEVAS